MHKQKETITTNITSCLENLKFLNENILFKFFKKKDSI